MEMMHIVLKSMGKESYLGMTETDQIRMEVWRCKRASFRHKSHLDDRPFKFAPSSDSYVYVQKVNLENL